MKLIDRIRLNVLAHKTQEKNGGIIQAIGHRELRYGAEVFHRMYTKTADERVAGVGVSRDRGQALLASLMECIERKYYYSSAESGPTTSGLSCRFDTESSRRASLLELLERDQVLLTIYYGRELLELPSGDGVRFFYMTHDLPLHVVMAEILGEEGQRCYGFGAGLELNLARDKALAEALVIYDSRNVPVPDEIRGTLLHMVPFLKPGRLAGRLYPFQPSQRPIRTLEEIPASRFSWELLKQALVRREINVDYKLTSIPISPFLHPVICQAISADLQELFFSGNEIQLNRKRIERLGYPIEPLHPVLHPIS